jgi:tetratricopeptide (TPR) repeat protein
MQAPKGTHVDMMEPSLIITARRCLSGIVAGLAMMLTFAVSAQQPAADDTEGLDIQGLFEKAGALMEESRWEDALKPLGVIIKDYGPSGFQDFGPAFGVMWYRYGFCLKNVKKFDEALEAYNKCYTEGANPPNTPKDKLNPVWELSLLEMGVIKQALGRYDEAIKDYEAFAQKPAPAGTYDDAAFRVQVATCYSKAGQPDRAKKLLAQLFTPTEGQAPRADGLFRALLALVESWTSEGIASPETEKEAHDFITANFNKLRLTPYDMARFEFNNRLLVLARKASDANQQTLALRLISLIASSADVQRDLEGRVAMLNGRRVPDLLQKEIAKYSALAKADDSVDWIAALTLAGAHERLGNPGAAYAVYAHGVHTAPKSPHRSVMLFGAMRCALAIGLPDVSQRLGEQFRKEFPTNEYAKDVNTLMLESLFFSKQYEAALALATEVRGPMDEKDPLRDLPDFVVGASLFNLGRVEEAQKELASHSARFPESRFKEHVRYFEASALQRQKEWKSSGEKLDAFIKDYPNSDYIGYALLDRATCYFQLGDFQKCLDTTGDLMKRLPDYPDLDRALAMRGDAHMMLSNNAEAETAYLKALELSTAAGEAHAMVRSRVLVQLIRAASALEKPKEVIGYYDAYMKDHVGGYYDAEVVVGSINALKEAGRGKEALEALEKVIVRLGSGDTGAGIEEAIGSYTEHSIEINGADVLLDRLTKFVPDGTEVNNTLKAWLIMARIDLLQNDQYKDKFPKRAAQIQVAYEELQKFNKQELASYILTQVGRELSSKNTPETDKVALEWFQVVLDRGPADASLYPLALMGRARIMGRSVAGSSIEDSIAAFDKVIRELRDKPEYIEEAMLEKARIYYAAKRWEDAAKVLDAMQQDSRFTRSRAEVFYRLGHVYEELKEVDKALQVYSAFVGPPLENRVEYSAEARVRAAEIQMEKGNDKKAFALIKDTVARMYKMANHPQAGPFILKAREHYKKLRDKLGATPDPDEGIWGIK